MRPGGVASGQGVIHRLAERRYNRAHIGAAALAAFDLERRNSGAHEIGQQRRQVETDRLLECVIGVVAVPAEITALADGRIAGALAAGKTIYGEQAKLRG